MTSPRVYDIVLLGATGFTGKLCAEHITTHLPTDLKWAVAGRSASKLEQLVSEIKNINPDRLQPDIETVQLSKEDLKALVSKTKVVLNTIGPYHLYSEPVVAACAESGTYYLDVTGEIPWVKEMIEKYEAVAKSTGAIIISQSGIESVPSDMLAWSLVTLVREKLSAPVKDVVSCIYDMSMSPSGGTIATAIGIFEAYSAKAVVEASKPYALTPPGHPKPQLSAARKPSLVSRLLGIRSVPDLGVLTTSITSGPNVGIVHRSSGLMSALYGPRFTYEEYMRSRNVLTGTAIHFALATAVLLFMLAPVRWIARKFVYSPGQGPAREASSKDRLEMRAVCTVDAEGAASQRAQARFVCEGPAYYVTGVFLAQAAMVLLKDEPPAVKMNGGFLTPATLGQAYADRLRGTGMTLEAKLMSY